VFKSFFKLTADCIVKFQDICADHQRIASFITGAEINVHQTKIATCFHMFLEEISQNNFHHSLLNSIETIGIQD
jgi:hypothetical protein